MRDIRPAPKKPYGASRASRMPIMPSDEMYEVEPRQKAQKKLSGAKVPVTNVHVPPPQEIQQEAKAKPKRPLFAKSAVPHKMPKAPRKKIRLGRRERITVLTLLGIIAVVALLSAAIFLPSAHVKLVLATAPLLIDQDLTVRATETDLPSVVPGAGFFRQVAVEGQTQVVSTEMIGTKSSGTVDIVNKTSEEQKIKERSRLVTKDGVLFFMTRAVTVPGDSRASVPVEADQAGEGGNIQPQRLNFAALDAAAQSVVYGEVTKAITNGKGEEVHVIKEEDIERAKQAAQEAAEAKVRDEIKNELPKGWVLLDESWTAELANFTTDGQVESKQPQISYKADATVRVLGYEPSKLEERLTTALKSRLDQNYALFPGPISFSKTVKSVDWTKGEGIISARVTHTTIPDFSLETLKQKIARRNANEAKGYLEGLPGVRSVELELSPFWVRSIPRIESRINLEVVPERQP